MARGTPRVSVLMPVRNAAATLETALRSLAEQTFTDLEIIAVDDGSTDATPRMLLRASATHPRLRVITTPPRGIAAALNHASTVATGEILARMDADDIAYPDRLARQVALLEAEPDLMACGTLVRYIPRSGLRDGARRYERWVNSVVTPVEIERNLFVECPIPHPTLMVRRRAFPGYRDGPFPEDYDLLLRMAGPMAKVPDVLLDWRESIGRLSRTDTRYGAEAFRRLKVTYLRGRRLRDRPVVVWGAGPVGKAFALELLRADVRVVAFVELDPRKIGQRIHGAPVIAPDGVAKLPEAYVVAAVGQVGAREEIRAALSEMGRAEPGDWCAVA